MAAVRQRELMHHAERFNSLTHLAGAVLAVVGVTLLVVSASREGDPWKIVSFAVYGTTLLLLFVFPPSTTACAAARSRYSAGLITSPSTC